MFIVITGLFKESHGKNNKDIIRHFNRSFLIVPEGTGFCISNEQLHISQATVLQEKKFSLPGAMQSVPGPSTSVTCPNDQGSLTEEVKQQMTMTLSQRTNMNVEWSFKCLEEVFWNFENACAAFQEALSQGKIPTSAFNK